MRLCNLDQSATTRSTTTVQADTGNQVCSAELTPVSKARKKFSTFQKDPLELDGKSSLCRLLTVIDP